MGEFVRKISYNEQLYLDFQDLSNTYAIQFCFSVTKLTDLSKVEEAVNEVISGSPGINVCYKNRRYYAADEPVRIREITIDSDNVFDDEIFKKPIDYTKKSVEVLYITNVKKHYLVFQIQHAVLDGMASLVFVQNVMNHLAGREIIPCESDMTDIQFVKNHPSCRISENKLPTIKIKDSTPVRDYRIKWEVVEVPGYPAPVVAKLARVLASFCEELPTRIMVPTDVRKHEPGKRYNTNLTLPVFLTVKEGDTTEDVYANMLMQLKEKKDLNAANTTYFHYRELPEWMRKAALKFLINRAAKTNRFAVGGLISFLGKVDFADFENPVISFDDFYSFPIHEPLCPISLTAIQYLNKTAVCISYYEGQFSDSWMESFKEAIRQEMKPGIYDNFVKKRTLPYPVAKNLLQSFADHKEERAVLFEEGEITYKELSGLVYEVIKSLKAENILGPVGLYISRGPVYIAAAFACLLSGISFIPIDKTKTEKELEELIQSSGMQDLFADEEVKYKCLEGLRIHRAPDMKPKKEREPVPADYPVPDEDNPAKEVYRIYTSGTTNKPKGVPISSENLGNYLGWAVKEWGRESANMPLFTSLSVDLTMTSLFVPILTGGWIRSFRDPFRPDIMAEIIKDDCLNVVKCTPTHLQFVPKGEYDCKKTLIIGGENLPVSLCAKLTKQLKNVRIYNEYGPTETTVGITFHVYDETEVQRDVQTVNVPVGVPIDNTAIVLLKDGVLVLKEHEIGEICITGKSVFDGYADSSDNPFVKVHERKYYKTGDLGFIANGILHCVGRIGSQVKINGNRVELDYIANAIKEIPGVENAVVLYEGNLLAYAVSDISEETIRETLLRNLPGYMVPKHVYRVSEIPINSSGKTDFAKLKQECLAEDLTKDSVNDRISDTEDPVREAFRILESEGVYRQSTLSSLGMESVDILLFLQEISDKYLSPETEKEFYGNVLPKINEITFADLAAMLKEYSAKQE